MTFLSNCAQTPNCKHVFWSSEYVVMVLQLDLFPNLSVGPPLHYWPFHIVIGFYQSLSNYIWFPVACENFGARRTPLEECSCPEIKNLGLRPCQHLSVCRTQSACSHHAAGHPSVSVFIGNTRNNVNISFSCSEWVKNASFPSLESGSLFL